MNAVAVINEAPEDAVCRLFARELADGFACTGIYRYDDRDGRELFRVVRLDHAEHGKLIRPIHRPRGHYVVGRGPRPEAGWPLYVPPCPRVETDPLYVVEGEKCADALAERGVSVLTSCGGSDGVATADFAALADRGRRVVRIWPDFDPPGADYAKEVRAVLERAGIVVEVIDAAALALPPKGDCVDWLARHPNATAEDVARLPLLTAARASISAATDRDVRVILRRGSEVEPKPVEWLMPGWLAAGKLHLIAGPPGSSKTTIALSMAATLTAGGRWPDGSPAPTGDVVIWSGEDDDADTLNPRLRAAGADMQRIHVVGGVIDNEKSYPFDPSQDMDALQDALQALPDVRLIVIDPVVSAVSGDSHKNAEVRRSLQPLVDIAAVHRCAVLGVTHFSKGTAGRDPVERLTGSLAFGALPRIVMVVAKETARGELPGRTILLRAKSNIGPDGGGFVYDVEQRPLAGYPDVAASTVQWGEWLDGSARDLLAGAEADDERSAVDEAGEWLRHVLAAGPLSAAEVLKQARQAGLSDKALRSARERMGIKPQKDGFNAGWTWRLPKMPDRTEGAHTQRRASSISSGTFEEADSDGGVPWPLEP